ncbi:hypothetical protein [Natribacillus halophilus]|uniref:Uncharacterized protein n=1 Tax=Natribacillus halophilus TaxID=549003 RepID=A0A1G8P1N8_9BACI|nr:hypothetical protein [Natribacillus halophilus]SDI85750.1 hypothetical protein SAMN04488123_107123 [Natribacillus halophilus]
MNNKAASSLLIAGIGSVGTAIYMMTTQRSNANLMSRLKKNKYYKSFRKAYRRAF